MHAWQNRGEVAEVGGVCVCVCVCVCGWDGGCTEQVPIFGKKKKRGHLNTNYPPPPLSALSLRDGGKKGKKTQQKTKNRKFHINTKTSQRKQSDE